MYLFINDVFDILTVQSKFHVIDFNIKRSDFLNFKPSEKIVIDSKRNSDSFYNKTYLKKSYNCKTVII